MSNTFIPSESDCWSIKADDYCEYTFNSLKPSYTIQFTNTNGVVGTLDFNGPELVFTGDADESAKALIKWVDTYFQQRLKEEQKKVFEECVDTLWFHGWDDSVDYVKWAVKNKFGIDLE